MQYFTTMHKIFHHFLGIDNLNPWPQKPAHLQWSLEAKQLSNHFVFFGLLKFPLNNQSQSIFVALSYIYTTLYNIYIYIYIHIFLIEVRNI